MSKLTKALTAAAGNAGGGALYAEDVFSTYLYTGTATTNNIVNGVDLTEGGLVWFKTRDDVGDHNLVDSERGINKGLESNTTDAEIGSAGVTAFNSDGFTVDFGFGKTNSTSSTYASWTFRKAEKFFDVVTYTGDGTTSREIAHNLGSVPGFVLIKRTDSSSNWAAWCIRGNGTQAISALNLNTTAASGVVWHTYWLDGMTDSVINLAKVADDGGGNTHNVSGGTYVAYLFASDAGGFGDDGSESIIKCGSYTGTGAGGTPPVIDLGFEPQWLLTKQVSAGTAGNWMIMDTMRGWGADGADLGPEELKANTSDGEFDWGQYGYDLWTVNPTGFTVGPTDLFNVNNQSGVTYIYIAIRRPMKTPESGTEVFQSLAYTGDGASTRNFDLNLTLDAYFQACRSSASYDFKNFTTRLTGKGLYTAGTGGELVTSTSLDVQDGLRAINLETTLNQSGQTYIINGFKRATGFMDVVAYTATPVASGQTDTEAHNLGVAPELIIVKNRTGGGNIWMTYHENVGINKYLKLETSEAVNTGNWSFPVLPTPSEFTTGWAYPSGNNLIAYLFATLAGVSKVGSYTGTGSNVDVDCGFSAGARFILIKRTDSTGDWYVYDSVRGIVAGNDPYLLLNSTAAEVTNTDYIDPLSSGFTVTSSAPAALNASGGSYIFLAIS